MASSHVNRPISLLVTRLPFTLKFHAISCPLTCLPCPPRDRMTYIPTRHEPSLLFHPSFYPPLFLAFPLLPSSSPPFISPYYLYIPILFLGIEWNTSQFTTGQACMLYAAQFSKEGHGRYIAAGGSGANEAKVFDHRNENTVIGKCFMPTVFSFFLFFSVFCVRIFLLLF